MSFRSLAVALAAALALLLVGTAAAESPNVNTPASMTGSAVVGAQLTAHNGTWLYLDGSGCKSECVMAYQWQRCAANGCLDIPGATGRFYTVQAADAGHSLRAMETMTSEDCGNINYSTGEQECRFVSKSAPSGQTAVVPGSAPTGPTPPAAPAVPAPQAPLAPVATAAPRISGLTMVEETLTASRGSWTGSPTLALQWLRCDAQGQNCADLGLSDDSYTLIPFDVGKTLRVRITALNGAGAREALSDATAVVSDLKPTEEKPSLAAAKVLAPHRLVVGEVLARPKKLSRPGKVTVTLLVSDSRGFRISGALVTAAVLPGTALVAPGAATTDEQGLVTLVFERGTKLYVKKPRPITLVLTARRPGDRATSPRAAVVRVQVAVAAKKR